MSRILLNTTCAPSSVNAAGINNPRPRTALILTAPPKTIAMPRTSSKRTELHPNRLREDMQPPSNRHASVLPQTWRANTHGTITPLSTPNITATLTPATLSILAYTTPGLRSNSKVETYAVSIIRHTKAYPIILLIEKRAITETCPPGPRSGWFTDIHRIPAPWRSPSPLSCRPFHPPSHLRIPQSHRPPRMRHRQLG
jgi:hypothetical protein